MDMSRIDRICESIRKRVPFVPEVLVILGSGLGSMAEQVEDQIVIKYEEIDDFLVSTVEGHAGQFVFGTYKGKKVAMMQGRFHYYEGYSMKEVTLPVYVMRRLGVMNLIVTNSCGGVNTELQPGDLMLIEDHLNFTGNNPLMGRNFDEFGPRFPDMSKVYDRALMSLADRIAEEESITLKKGVYAIYTGPSYETPAEIRAYRTLGADAIGMSTVPEAIVANHGGMRVLGVSCITNMAAGILDQPLNHEEVIEVSARVRDSFTTLISRVIEEM
ncbi:purine-nucleoside phosphorylase [Proteiniclasticum sp. C24MP]|uniref:purine-nucleoside phosphorylase n=1 Tax=Proteiniclasticum sp. C24MP TaxID=3374101 RepID=UPI0037542BCE